MDQLINVWFFLVLAVAAQCLTTSHSAQGTDQGARILLSPLYDGVDLDLCLL